MTAERAFDRLVATWLDGRSTLHVPDGLLERSLARVDATRQRPGWLVRDRGRSPRAAGRSTRVDLRWAAAAVAVVVVAIGAGLVLRPSPATTVGPSGSPPVAPASPGSSPNPTAVQPKAIMVAFLKSSGGYVNGLWVANADGTGARQLAPDLAGSPAGPSWSPDGTRLLFSLSPVDQMGYPSTDWLGARLYLADLNRGAPELVDTGCVAPCLGDGDGAFSPDGSQLAFIRNDTRLGRIVATLDLATGRVTELTSTTIPPGKYWGGNPGTYRPRWSPDGTEIVFAQDVALTDRNKSLWVDGPPPALFVVDADGRNLHQISSSCGLICHEDWSRDGTGIVFETWSEAGSAQHQFSDIYTVRPDGTGLRRLTSDRISSFPSWTADGRIAFIKVPMTNGDPGTMQPAQFWLMASDGANATRPSLAPLLQQVVLSYELPLWQPTP